MSSSDGLHVAAELQRAREELRKGAAASAVERLERLRTVAPANPRVGAALAKAYLQTGRTDAALAVAEETVRDAPRSTVALVALGQARRRARDFAGAIEAFARARAEEPSPFTDLLIGRVQLQTGEAERALETARTALRVHGRERPLLELEGDALVRLGRIEEALASYEEARGIVPDDPELERRLLAARLSRLPPAEAAEELARLVEVPSYGSRAWLHRERGRVLHELGRHAEAASALSRALGLDPDDRQARRLLGFAAWKAGDADGAIAALRPLFLEEPGDRYVRSTLLAAYLKAGRESEAEATLEEALRARPDTGGLHGELKKLRLRSPLHAQKAVTPDGRVAPGADAATGAPAEAAAVAASAPAAGAPAEAAAVAASAPVAKGAAPPRSRRAHRRGRAARQLELVPVAGPPRTRRP